MTRSPRPRRTANLFQSHLKYTIAVAIAVFSQLCFSPAAAANPVPTVVGPPVPQAVLPASGQFTLKVYGANFVQGAVVNWNRQPRKTTFISARELQATILASDVAKPTAGYITVTNPPPGARVSSSSYAIVEVHTPTNTIIVGRPYLTSNYDYPLVFSDFNNDGVLDLENTWGTAIRVRLGKGDGTFGRNKIAAHGYNNPAAIVSGDFNNDGNEDLIFGANPNPPPNFLRTTLGNGDGTFRKGSRFGNLSYYANGLAAADFNRDGNLDVASVTNPSHLDVFLGEGDGSFKHRGGYNAFSKNSPFNILSADLNGDGILDLVVLADGVYTLLGRGDGTFERPQLLRENLHAGCGTGNGDIWVSDFNGDGKADLAYCERDQNSGKIWVFLGNGDGTFQKPVSLTVPANQGVFSFAVGDFNSDGKTDILTNYYLPKTFLKTETDLFLGNGDGTFQRKKIIRLPGQSEYNAENGIVAVDLNSDGLLDLIIEQAGPLAIFVQR